MKLSIFCHSVFIYISMFVAVFCFRVDIVSSSLPIPRICICHHMNVSSNSWAIYYKVFVLSSFLHSKTQFNMPPTNMCCHWVFILSRFELIALLTEGMLLMDLLLIYFLGDGVDKWMDVFKCPGCIALHPWFF